MCQRKGIHRAEELLVSNVIPMRGGPTDLRIIDGRIVEMGVSIAPGAEAEIMDGQGQLIFPGFVDAHAHMDKT